MLQNFQISLISNNKNKGCDLVTHINLKTMKTEFNITWDFLKQQQEEDKLTTNQLHLIIQTLTAYLSDEQLKEVQNLFNLFKN